MLQRIIFPSITSISNIHLHYNDFKTVNHRIEGYIVYNFMISGKPNNNAFNE